MKKIFFIIATVVLTTTSSFAQHFDIRAYGGVNILQLTSDNGTTLIDGITHSRRVNGRPGAQFGAAVTFGSRFFVQPGFQYNLLSKETVHEIKETKNKKLDVTSIKSISVPLKVGFRLIDPETENLINVRLFGGIDGSHILSIDHTEKSGDIDDIDTDDFSNLILSADLGLGFDIFIFYLDMGYQIGLTPVYTGGDNAKANAFYSNIGLRISF